ncbi:hypothetical protein [Ilumatobacter coccineus]|uniref:Uncharacterized protein n=1 Tax=Ilumatobacter coccineus (strain NBRC 103263 / KCTC 29153 / YM16-304) TaxID=1313172 RepID=A0A6C7DZS9_ILUCY|nr:hypothetical protein [Ilumatobacter coccineus]BAN00370.1 hypothetical protein YM304_00560 [Ilumatobacter coccineus YM16-304]
MPETPTSTSASDPLSDSADPSSTPRLAVIVGGVMLFVLGATIGLLGGLVLADDTAETPSASDAIDCDEATDIVEAAITEIGVLETSPTQDAGFFAALIVEQRKVTFTMDAAPDCFTLADRAGANGLLAGIHALFDASTSDVSAPSTGGDE